MPNGRPAIINEEHRIILVGVVHGDPQGYVRARRLLALLEPDMVTVEISRFSLKYRLKHGRAWQRQLTQVLSQLPAAASRHLAIRRLAVQVGLPFEVKAARDYQGATGKPWRALDVGGLARRHLPRYGPELLSPANLRALLITPDGTLAEFAAAEFNRARQALVRPTRRLPMAATAETLRRELLMARRLRLLTSRYHRVVHLGGWEHLVPWQDSPGLWEALTDLQPRRLLLDEADTMIT